MYALINSKSANAASSYKFGEISRGNLESTISSTGTLSPVVTVEVGTQVSGTIDTVFVDYNDEVKTGQLLAVLDTVLLKASLTDAQANVEKAEASLEQAVADHERFEKLFQKNMISEADFLPYQIALKTSRASLKSAEASAQRAKANLDYAIIRSPIDGTVIAKNVEAGQTVAASLSTPTLFQIAQDLSRMEILADVDESDIGLIKSGQKVRFEVQAYSDRTFTGTVTQVRLQPTTISNVVTYTVVVEAANDGNLLLPGMTATVDFIVDSRENVLLIPASALRYQPSETDLADFQERMEARFASEVKDSSQQMGGGPRGQGAPGQVRRSDVSRVWYIDEAGNLMAQPVKVGMTDGTKTEVVTARDLNEGSQVIIGTATDADDASSSTTKSTKSAGPPMGGPRGF